MRPQLTAEISCATVIRHIVLAIIRLLVHVAFGSFDDFVEF
jgi:hypothetical protein